MLIVVYPLLFCRPLMPLSAGNRIEGSRRAGFRQEGEVRSLPDRVVLPGQPFGLDVLRQMKRFPAVDEDIVFHHIAHGQQRLVLQYARQSGIVFLPPGRKVAEVLAP